MAEPSVADAADGKTKPVWGEVLHYTLINEKDMHVAVGGALSHSRHISLP